MKLNAQSFLAENSNDHLYPVGAVNDNYTNYELINKIKLFFNKKINFLDLEITQINLYMRV